jgi:hypothetical protein
MYNKIRMGIMLAGFTLVTLIGLSYSGNVSDACRSEWEFPGRIRKDLYRKQSGSDTKSETGAHSKHGKDDAAISQSSEVHDVTSAEEEIAGEVVNEEGFKVGKSVGKRLSDLDLIFPNFLFAL